MLVPISKLYLRPVSQLMARFPLHNFFGKDVWARNPQKATCWQLSWETVPRCLWSIIRDFAEGSMFTEVRRPSGPGYPPYEKLNPWTVGSCSQKSYLAPDNSRREFQRGNGRFDLSSAWSHSWWCSQSPRGLHFPEQIWFPFNWFWFITLGSENPQQGLFCLFLLAWWGIHWKMGNSDRGYLHDTEMHQNTQLRPEQPQLHLFFGGPYHLPSHPPSEGFVCPLSFHPLNKIVSIQVHWPLWLNSRVVGCNFMLQTLDPQTPAPSWKWAMDGMPQLSYICSCRMLGDLLESLAWPRSINLIFPRIKLILFWWRSAFLVC